MRLLFEIDMRDHDGCTRTFVGDSARAIVVRDKKAAMVHSQKYDYYKFPGGGIEPGEGPVEAMIRETREETGLVVIPDTVREHGYVHRVQKSDIDETERFVQDNFYYLCETADMSVPQQLDDYEAKEVFTLEYVRPEDAIWKNRHMTDASCDKVMCERDARVLELLMAEGLFD